MKRIILSAAVAAIMSTAYASPGDDGCVGNCPNNGGDGGSSPITITSSPSAKAGAISGAFAGAKSTARSNSKSIGVGVGLGGKSVSSSSAVGGRSVSDSSASISDSGNSTVSTSAQGGNSTASSGDSQSNLTYNESERMKYSGSYDVKTVGAAIASNVQATSGCRKPINAAGGWMGGAFSFGTTFLDETCVTFEFIRFAQMSSDPKVRALGSELMTFGLQEQLKEHREKARKEAAKAVNAYQPPKAADSVSSNIWDFQIGG